MATSSLSLWSLLIWQQVASCLGEEALGSIAELYTQTILGAVTGTLGIPYDANPTKGCNQCLTMVGIHKLRSFGDLLLDVWQRDVPGDVLEAGAWKGGVGLYAAALMRAYASMADRAHGDRRIVLADTFTGIPRPSSTASGAYDQIDFHHLGQESVKDVFHKFGLLSDRVRLIEGSFLTTFPQLRSEYLQQGRKLAVLRLDADMYESYLDVLYNLYDLVSVGGYIICDDCVEITETDRAFAGFFQHHLILDQRLDTPGTRSGAYWRKANDHPIDVEAYLKWVQARAAVQARNGTKQLQRRATAAERRVTAAVERFALIRLESYVARSEKDLDRICMEQSFPFVVLLVAPLGAAPRTLAEDELTWTVSMGEALRPDWSSCATVVVVDSAAPFDGALDEVLMRIKAESWQGVSGLPLALGILCETKSGTAEQVLDLIYSNVRKKHTTAAQNVHRYEGALRAWIADACSAVPIW